ncbi:TetR/AcrR family transcriptional regulator [Nocardioides sp. Bht2]|uniref:TetR/AcrR family transcriptional regulator n=1 Tax=Nocardioides sp. Bht2 TaxID=3392297 RepID=UPI0039B6B15E
MTESTSAVPSPSLRERRRHQTESEICRSALDLFERFGVAATTVEQIAEAAGVSARTVFRYFPHKEDAALVPHRDIEATVTRRLAAFDGTAPLLPQLEQMWEEILTGFDNGDSDSGRQMLRVWCLISQEPTLLAASLRAEAERMEQTVAVLREALGTDADDLRPRLAAESLSTLGRVTIETWAARRAAGRDVDLLDTFRQAREAAHRLIE